MKFSIVTPSLNQGAFLQECLDSVKIAATAVEGEVEHLIMDGGSTDRTCAILESQTFAKWKSEPDKGQSHAINKGLQSATGDILSYLCSDDLLEPQVLRLVTEQFQSDPAIDVVYGDGYFLEGDSGWKRRKIAGSFSIQRLSRHNFFIQPAVFWRRSVYDRFGGFDEDLRYCMDHEYWLRLGDRVKWSYINQSLAVSRLHVEAKTSSELVKAWWEAAKMQRQYGRILRPWLDAMQMTLGGAAFYRLKRQILQTIGRRNGNERGEKLL